MNIFSFSKFRANRLNEAGRLLYAEGREKEAIAKYLKAIACDPNKSEAHYNLGLVYKYRREWEKSFDANLIANRLVPDDEAARWNLAIAATALRRWDVARKAWRENGIQLDGDEGPIDMEFGATPVRLNADDSGEVVWGTRIDPVRAMIDNIPFPESGFHHGDIVLHDGAATGYRVRNGREYPVFNVLELFERSLFETKVVAVQASDPACFEVLGRIVDTTQSEYEDWTENVRALCRQCSEGKPHEDHDHELSGEWKLEHRLGFACHPADSVDDILRQWQSSCGAKVLSVE